MVFSSIAAFVDRATGYTESAFLKTVHKAFYDLSSKLLSGIPNYCSLKHTFLKSKAT